MAYRRSAGDLRGRFINHAGLAEGGYCPVCAVGEGLYREIIAAVGGHGRGKIISGIVDRDRVSELVVGTLSVQV